MIYEQGVKKYSPFYKVKEKEKKWFNRKCERIKKRDEVWRKMKKNDSGKKRI